MPIPRPTMDSKYFFFQFLLQKKKNTFYITVTFLRTDLPNVFEPFESATARETFRNSDEGIKFRVFFFRNPSVDFTGPLAIICIVSGHFDSGCAKDRKHFPPSCVNDVNCFPNFLRNIFAF